MSDEWVKNFIDEQCREIVEALGSGTFCGVPVDINNPKMVLVSAYHLGWTQGIWSMPPDPLGKVKQ
jgi:hypothetical protein